MTATYSEKWFQTFCSGIDDEQTALEAAFLRRMFPLPAFPRVLDVGCGMGRHVLALAKTGYEVTGLESNAAALAAARTLCGARAQLLPGDMRKMSGLDRNFDAVICMWATFGAFSAAENEDVLASMAERLRGDGRLVLDIYDPAFFKDRSRRPFERNGAKGIEFSSIRDGRRHVRLTYAGSEVIDEFVWQLFTADQLAQLAAPTGLKLVRECSKFHEGARPAGSSPRMQLVFEKSL